MAVTNQAKVIAAIGPEGGWTDQEVLAAESAGFQRVDLGRRIYRTETAAVVIGGWATMQVVDG